MSLAPLVDGCHNDKDASWDEKINKPYESGPEFNRQVDRNGYHRNDTKDEPQSCPSDKSENEYANGSSSDNDQVESFACMSSWYSFCHKGNRHTRKPYVFCCIFRERFDDLAYQEQGSEYYGQIYLKPEQTGELNERQY